MQLRLRFIPLLVAGAFLGIANAGANPPAVTPLLIEWNERVLAVAQAEDRFLTLKGLRTAAMMHVAIHDTLNAIEPRYHSYRYHAERPDADPLSAAAQAAFQIAVSQYPDQRATFETLLQRWPRTDVDQSTRQAGIELGEAAAQAILAAREGDAWNSEAEYTWHPMAPGVYAEFAEHSGTPEGFVFGAGWAAARPFMLERQNQFRAPPPPAIDSPAYAVAFDEVKDVGRFESASRSADQTHLALWWKDFAENSHNRLARQLAAEQELDARQAARLFALLNMSIYDAYINVFENKFHYNHWRPYTAIRWAANDGNPATAADPEWDNTHRHTYAFPSYPSAHGCACAAAMTVLAETFGKDHGFTMTTANVAAAGPFSEEIAMDPPQRSFPNFAQAAEECALSRVYLGIHFRYDSTAGNVLGRQIGEYALANFLQPTP